MASRESIEEKLRKVEALGDSATATDGEKAAAKAAADRMRAELTRQRAKAAKASAAKAADGGLLYLLGRAWSRRGRERGDESAPAKTGTMYFLGKAWRKAMSRPK